MKSFSEIRFDIVEVLTKDDPAGKWISDFVKSDNPKFEGKSEKKRKQMALAAYYAKQNESKEAEVEEPEEVEKKEDSVLKKAKKKEVDKDDKEHVDESNVPSPTPLNANGMNAKKAKSKEQFLKKKESVQNKFNHKPDNWSAEFEKRMKNEELKGDQHKLDKNKNGKLDKEDFKKLRKEEQELEEGLPPETKMKHRVLVSYSDPHHTSVSMRKEKVQKHLLVPSTNKNGESIYKAEAEEYAKKYMKKQGYKVHGVEHVGLVNKKVNEEAGTEVAEGWDEMMKAVKDKAKPQPNGGAGKKQGSRYGGSKQKEEPVKEGLKPEHNLKPGWMLKKDPELAKKIEAKKKAYKALAKYAGKPIEKKD